MKILVCVKRAFPAEQAVVIDESGGWICENLSGDLPALGRYDEMAIEQALMIKDLEPGVSVDAITVGPQEDSSVLRRALAMGADRGIHIVAGFAGYVSALTTASLIANAVSSRSYDLALTGVMSDDMNQSLVGPMLAELLQLPCVTSCSDVTLVAEKRLIRVERDIEGARKQILEMDLPGLVTIQSCRNKPRYPSLSNIMRANSQKLEIIGVNTREQNGRTEEFNGLGVPQKSRVVRFLNGSASDKASELLSIIRSRGLLI